MCTRFHIELSDEVFRRIVEESDNSPVLRKFRTSPLHYVREGEVRPTDVVPVLAPDPSGRRRVYPMRFGYTFPGKSAPIVNARVETAGEKPSFSRDYRSHRCIIPASWYYEWEHLRNSEGKIITGRKFLIQPAGAKRTWLAGLYRIEDGLPRFVILTRQPSEAVRKIHDRMPLILPEERIDDWINPSGNPEELLPFAVTDLFFTPFQSDGLMVR